MKGAHLCNNFRSTYTIQSRVLLTHHDHQPPATTASPGLLYGWRCLIYHTEYHTNPSFASKTQDTHYDPPHAAVAAAHSCHHALVPSLAYSSSNRVLAAQTRRMDQARCSPLERCAFLRPLLQRLDLHNGTCQTPHHTAAACGMHRVSQTCPDSAVAKLDMRLPGKLRSMKYPAWHCYCCWPNPSGSQANCRCIICGQSPCPKPLHCRILLQDVMICPANLRQILFRPQPFPRKVATHRKRKRRSALSEACCFTQGSWSRSRNRKKRRRASRVRRPSSTPEPRTRSCCR